MSSTHTNISSMLLSVSSRLKKSPGMPFCLVMRSIDDDIRQAMLDANGGSPPDDFIEDAQGGGLDSDVLARQDPEANQALIDALDRELTEMGAGEMPNTQLRHD